MTGPHPLLDVSRLTVRVPDGPVLVDDLEFQVRAGDRLAIVGESGSGKSVTARALLHLDSDLDLDGSVRLDGHELLTLGERQLASIRGRRISMVFQDPLAALHPTRTIGDQVAEPLLVHGVGRREAHRRAGAALDELGIADARRRMRAYPHEFSGGMRQRVVLAMALVGEPELLVADEPTTALDARVQHHVLELLDQVASARGLAVILITHEVGIVAGFADRVLVMYSGRAVEQGGVQTVLGTPRHPYTRALLSAVPRLDTEPGTLVALPGATPAPAQRPSGCAFHPRCPAAVEVCRTERPARLPVGPGEETACHLVTVSSAGHGTREVSA
jgi:oligopeptide/dipeptide ABC transporter ATP-binding protein